MNPSCVIYGNTHGIMCMTNSVHGIFTACYFSLLTSTGATHWGQQSFYLHPPVDCAPGDVLRCSINVQRRKDNHRLLEVEMGVQVEGKSIHAQQSQVPRKLSFKIE